MNHNDQQWLTEVLARIDRKLQKEMIRVGDQIPYIANNGVYDTDMRKENLSWWTNGFWSGMLWQMYHATGNDSYRSYAKRGEESLDRAFETFTGLHHDVGFMWLHTAVANYRLTQNEQSKVRGLHAATLLAGRFNPNGNYFRAWNLDKPGWMIVDCLMNLPLLFWASSELGDPRFADLAVKHADTALQTLLRADGSCNHIAVFDPQTGTLLELPGGQGYGEGSSWSRGQAWALYGFALTYLHTKQERFLDAAKRCAHYFIANTALTGGVALADFRAPKEPVRWDTTASACAACGLLQLAEMVPELERPLYFNHAAAMLKALNEAHCDWDQERDGILLNGTAAYHHAADIHVPIIYGDYFFVEGILRLLNKNFLIW